MNKNFSAKKYFIYAFKKYITNDNKVLSKNFSPSIREILFDYIDIYEDVSHSVWNEKLEKSRKELIEASIFFIKENIFYCNGIYKDELDILIKDLCDINKNNSEKDGLQYIKVYNMCKSLVKKINYDNVYNIICEIIKTVKDFSVVDKITEVMVSELLYDGYSLTYINSWYNDNIKPQEITEDNIDSTIENFLKFKADDSKYIYYLNIYNKGHFIKNEVDLGYKLKIKKQNYDELELCDGESKNVKNYLQYNKDCDIYRTEIYAKDSYKGLDIIMEAFNSYFQMINYLNDDDNGVHINDKTIIQTEENNFIKRRIKNYDDEVLFYKTEKREKQDIEDFIKYRDNVYNKNIGFDEISNIQRTINIVKGQKEQTRENRLINLWSVLEYMLTFQRGNSIISKVKDIIPKVICLYTVKEKLNTFWNILYQYKGSKNEIVNEFIMECKKDDNEYQYDLQKLLNFISEKGAEKNGEKLIQAFEFNDVLKRKIAEIGMILFDKKQRSIYINKKYYEVMHDLVRIYRDRNVLIHSGRRTIRNINCKTLRLYQYNNSLLGVIIHYKRNNPYLTITEILNSIDYTYGKYVEKIENDIKKEELIDICRPKYLFIE